jgi:hypothetical protein
MAYTVLTLQHSDGRTFKALGQEDTISESEADAFGPAIALSRGWAYTVGSAPTIRCGRSQAAAQSTRLVMHTIESGGRLERVRVILLDASQVEVTFEDVEKSQSLTKDQSYVDVWLDSSGGFERFGDVEPFDRNTTPGSIGLMDEIDVARAQHNVE